MHSKRPIWRTMAVTGAGLVVLLVGFHWAAATTEGKELYAILRDGVVLLVATFATKGLGEVLAGGGGVKGAVKALMSDAKPEEPK